MLLDLRDAAGLSDLERAALEVLAAWDGSRRTGPVADMEFAGYDAGDEQRPRSGPPRRSSTASLDELVDDLFGFLRDPRYTEDGGEWTFDLVGPPVADGPTRLRHVATAARCAARPRPVDLDADDATRLRPGTDCATRSSSTSSRATVDALAAAQGDDPSVWRSSTYSEARGTPPTTSATPPGRSGRAAVMPFLERGTWIHYVGWEPAATDVTTAPTPGVTPAPSPGGGAGSLPATGGGFGVVTLLALGAAARLRHRRDQ